MHAGFSARGVGAVGCVVVLALLWIAPVTVEPALWGASSWRGVPAAWRPLLVAVGLSLALLPETERLGGVLRARPLSRSAVVALVLAAMAAFWLLQTQVHWANAEIAAKAIGRGEVDLKHTLATTLAVGVSQGWRAVGGKYMGADALRIVSVLAGGLYLLGSVALGRALFPSSRVKARCTTALLVTAGLLQQFFGVVETYPLSLPAQLWVLVLIARAYDTEGSATRRSCALLLLAASVSTGVFVATVFLWPAVLLTVARRGRLRPIGPQVAAVLVPLLIAVLAFRFWGRTLEGMSRSFGGVDRNPWVPVNAEDGNARTTHFLLFSLEHAAARANAAFLAAPAWIPLALVACIPGQSAESVESRSQLRVALLLAALGSLSYAFLINPDGGPVTEWMETTTGLLVPFACLVFFVLDRSSEARAIVLTVASAGVSLLG